MILQYVQPMNQRDADSSCDLYSLTDWNTVSVVIASQNWLLSLSLHDIDTILRKKFFFLINKNRYGTLKSKYTWRLLFSTQRDHSLNQVLFTLFTAGGHSHKAHNTGVSSYATFSCFSIKHSLYSYSTPCSTSLLYAITTELTNQLLDETGENHPFNI